jgi:peptidoglycan/xylan/chitin deacetylase (PgdA/CDA1 family)
MTRGLRPGPSLLYPLKAALTRGGSVRWLLRSRGRHDPAGVRILFYHRVSDDRDELAVTPRRFAQQLELLARDGFEVVGVPEVARRLRAGNAGPKLLGLSFDDGYRDVAEHGLPALERHGFAATVYVATGVIDGTARFAWYERQPELLGWDEIADLDRAGTFGFEAHTLTHPNLLELGDEACRTEIAGSKADLEERLGRAVTSFCYPAGLFGARERGYVEEAGFASAASCEPGVNDAGTDPLVLRRRQVDARDRLLDFRAKVGGGHDAPPPLRSSWRRLRYGAPSSRS